jgi:hypothetical protein
MKLSGYINSSVNEIRQPELNNQNKSDDIYEQSMYDDMGIMCVLYLYIPINFEFYVKTKHTLISLDLYEMKIKNTLID